MERMRQQPDSVAFHGTPRLFGVGNCLMMLVVPEVKEIERRGEQVNTEAAKVFAVA